MKASYKFNIKFMLEKHEFIMLKNETEIAFIKNKMNYLFL